MSEILKLIRFMSENLILTRISMAKYIMTINIEMIKIFNLHGILILNITLLLQDNTWLPTIESVCVRR